MKRHVAPTGDVVAPSAVRRRLLRHYREHARELPWRRRRDPYQVWVSEIMLQQTRVSVVAQRYAVFLERFPDVRALAASSPEAVAEAWAGLGYYRRAERLHAAARQVVAGFGGRIPKDLASLAGLPGVGDYTAGAIASIAYQRPHAAIDGNVGRVLARLLGDTGATRARPSRALREFARRLVACRRPGDVNQALMDLGASVCSPRRPQCSLCPLREHCRGHATGHPERFPRRAPQTPKQRLEVAFAWIPTRAGLWLERRPLGALWGGLWELPAEHGRRARVKLAARLGIELDEILVRVRHELSHRNVHATVYGPIRVALRRTGTAGPYRAPLEAPLHALARKAISAAVSRGCGVGVGRAFDSKRTGARFAREDDR
jgi:A/G-specific adenine glycosylase